VPASIGVGGASGSPQASATSMRVTAASWRSRKSAPLGSPVVPDVKTRATGRSGSSSRLGTGCGRASSASCSAESISSAPRPARGAAHGRLLRRGEARVHPGRDGAGLGHGRTGDDVGRVRREPQQHDVAGSDPSLDQPGRHLLRARVEVGVGQARPVGVDERRARAEALSRLADGGGEGHPSAGSGVRIRSIGAGP
jgi:hypothetical protein